MNTEITLDDGPRDMRLDLPSASNWHRYELCAGSYQLGKEAKRLGQEAFVSTKAGQSGSRIHVALEGKAALLDESETKTFEFLRELADTQIARVFSGRPVTEQREVRYWFGSAASGRADRVVTDGETLLVLDYKTGWVDPTPAEKSAQLKFLCVVAAIPQPKVSTVIGMIVSPHGVSEIRFEVAELSRAFDDIALTIKRINDEYAPFTPGEEQCKYCRALTICQAAKPAATQYDPLPQGGAQAAEVLEACAVLERRIKAIRDFYTERFNADPAYSLPGWSMQSGPRIRELTNALEARAKLVDIVGPRALDALASYSVPALEKLLKDIFKLKSYEASKRLAEILGETLVYKEANLILKRNK